MYHQTADKAADSYSLARLTLTNNVVAQWPAHEVDKAHLMLTSDHF
ncbi:MAG: hypothetical protein V7780_15150 [Colwellia sp.]